MNYYNFLIITLLSFSSFAQKANDDALKTNFHYLRYPEKEGLSTKDFAMSISEEYSCEGAVPAKTYTTPISVEPRANFYLAMVPVERLFFSQARELYGNMITKKANFTDIVIHAADIRLTNQTLKDKVHPKDYSQKLYSLSFDVIVPAEITIRRRGDIDEVLLEGNTNSLGLKKFTFPNDVKFSGEMTDVQRDGFLSQDALMNAWNKYKKYSTMQWRDKILSDFLAPIFSDYKQRFMLYEIWDQTKIFSDKNKKGGYDNIVSAATNFIGVFEAVENDYKAGKHSKQWTKEYQEQLNSSIIVWEAFLAETNFDITTDDKLISDDYRQKMALNYIQALILTGQFDKANDLIDKYLAQKVRNVTLSDLRSLKRTLDFEKKQFEAYSASKGWVKL